MTMMTQKEYCGNWPTEQLEPTLSSIRQRRLAVIRELSDLNHEINLLEGEITKRKNERASGYYWVELPEGGTRIILYWNSRTDEWRGHGRNKAEEWKPISPRLEEPK